MTGHIALPLLEDRTSVTNEENIIPSSISRKITTQLLRQQMNYKSLIVTDCLEMSAISDLPGGIESGAVKALQAGTDVVMICHTFARQCGAVEATYAAAQNGLIDLEEMKKSGLRIKKLKDGYAGLWEDVDVLRTGGILDDAKLEDMKDENKILSKEAYSKSAAWLIPDIGEKFVPLNSHHPATKNVLVFTPTMEKINPAVDADDSYGKLYSEATEGRQKPVLKNTAGPSYISFVESLQHKLGDKAKIEHIVYAANETYTEIDNNEATATLSNTDLVFVMRSADRFTWQLTYLRQLITKISYPQSNKNRLTLLSSNTPYDLINAREDIANIYPCLCTFEFTPEALDAAAAIICGESDVLGKMPVRVEF